MGRALKLQQALADILAQQMSEQEGEAGREGELELARTEDGELIPELLLDGESIDASSELQDLLQSMLQDLEEIHRYLDRKSYVGYLHFKTTIERQRYLCEISKSKDKEEVRKVKLKAKVARLFGKYRNIKPVRCPCRLKHYRYISEQTQWKRLSKQKNTGFVPEDPKPHMNLNLMIHKTGNIYQNQYSDIKLDDQRFVAQDSMKFVTREFTPSTAQLQILKKFEFNFNLQISNILESAKGYQSFNKFIQFLESETEGSLNPKDWEGSKELSPNSKTERLKEKSQENLENIKVNARSKKIGKRVKK